MEIPNPVLQRICRSIYSLPCILITIFSERNVMQIKQVALFAAKNGESCYVPTGLLFQKYIINYFFWCVINDGTSCLARQIITHTQVFYDYCHSHYNLANVRCHMFDSEINPSTSTRKPKILRLKTSAEKTCLESRAQEEVTARAVEQSS